jgi:hypothetical protein
MPVFRSFLGKQGREFSAVQTAWRSAQSGANLSPPKFPANREEYREFAISCPRICHSFLSKLHILLEKISIRLKSDRELTGMYQGSDPLPSPRTGNPFTT